MVGGFEDGLRNAGLTGNEARVYLALLKEGELSANEIAKRISMDRTLTYTILNHLIEKGLVSYVVRGSKKFFKAENPENLLNPVKEKEVFIKDFLKELREIRQVKQIPYEVNVYEGKEGLRTFIKLIMKHGKFCSFGATGRAYDYFYEIPALIKELESAGFTARIITSQKYKEHSMIKVRGVHTKYLDIEAEATTSIFGDYVSIHILTDKPFIILIKNKEIAESYRNYFEVLWKSAKS